MNAFVEVFKNEENKTFTTNGDVAYKSTLDACLDWFYKSAASRGVDVSEMFEKAYAENPSLAVSILLWLRDVREGAGERQQFKNAVLKIKDGDTVGKVIQKIPELGRWDDLLVFHNTPHQQKAFDVIKQGLVDKNALCAKWMPRQGKIAKELAKHCGLKNEAAWRKLVVSLSSTVEQQMCANKWDEIDFSKVPSVASSIYQKAFERHTPSYTQWVESVVKGEAKVNAGALYPYDIVRSVHYGNADVADAQWKALPDFLKGNETTFLPIVDVSGSMSEMVTPSVSCMDIAISLGMYLSERNEGVFKNMMVTFDSTPRFVVDKGVSLKERVNNISRLPWGMSTDIYATYMKLLEIAVQNNVKQEEMPSALIIVSDMQFNSCVNGVSSMTSAKHAYEQAGYMFPSIVFWTVNAKAGNIPVTKHSEDVCLVSGFSPSLMKSILKGNISPIQTMLDVVCKDRYSL